MTDEEKKAKEAADKAAAEAAAKKAEEDAKKAQPFATFETSEQFSARMEREARSILKKKGVDPDKIDAQLAELKALQEAKAAAEEAAKSEVQKAADARAKAEAEAKAAISDAEEARLKAHLYKTFAENGITNFDYAFFKVSSKLAELGDNDELDEVKYLTELKADPTQAAALGVVDKSKAAPKVEGATTTGQGAGQPDPQKPPGGGENKPSDAFQQTGEQFRSATQAKYGFTPPA